MAPMHRRTALARCVGLVALALTLASSCVAVAPSPSPPPPVRPGPPPDFYDAIDPYGDWWWNDTYGWVWSPYVGTAWRPYSVGHWVYTDDGWLWASSEPFGWACFHYGRWVWLDDAGWVWIPGHVWGPAWVAWRQGPGFIGWAPLGPGAVWVPGRGFVSTDIEVGIGVGWWVFVPHDHFLDDDVHHAMVHRGRNDDIVRDTHVLHRPDREERDDGDGRHEHVINRGVDVADAERSAGKAAQRMRAADVDKEQRVRVQQVERAPIDRDPSPRREDARLPDDELERRPLRAPDDDDPDDRWEKEKARTVDRYQREEKEPPPGVTPDQLQSRKQRELQRIDEEKKRDKDARDKKKGVPRPVSKKRPAKK